jgi:hypothetical protein
MTRTAVGRASVAQANEIGVHFGLAALVRQTAGDSRQLPVRLYWIARVPGAKPASSSNQ